MAKPKFTFPWRDGNRFELLIDADAFFPRMLDAIAGARRLVMLEMYLFESGRVATRFIDALVDAARRGVTVKLLLDDFGAFGLNRYDRRRLSDGGVEVVWYNRFRLGKLFDNLARDHRKLLLVDDAVAFVGGAGITDEFDPPHRPNERWRETMIQIEGPVITDWRALFLDVFNRFNERTFTPPQTTVRPFPDGMAGRVLITQGLKHQELKRALIKHVTASEQRVWIATAYFVPSWRIRRALRRAARRSVDVRVLLPGPLTDHPGVRHAGRRFYGRLLANGVRIFEYQPRVLHAKVVLCDHWVSVGSSNLDRWNIRWNLEANQSIESDIFAGRVMNMFNADFRNSIECRHEDWLNRPWRLRLEEWFWGNVDRFLTRLGRGRRGP